MENGALLTTPLRSLSAQAGSPGCTSISPKAEANPFLALPKKQKDEGKDINQIQSAQL